MHSAPTDGAVCGLAGFASVTDGDVAELRCLAEDLQAEIATGPNRPMIAALNNAFHTAIMGRGLNTRISETTWGH